MTEDQPNDDPSDPPAVPVLPDWARQAAMRMVDDSQEHISAARKMITARVIAELQGSASKAVARVEQLLDTGVNGSQVVAALDEALLDELRPVSERHQRILDAITGQDTITVTMDVVLPRLQARFEVCTVPITSTLAANNNRQISLLAWTQDPRILALVILMDFHSYLKGLREPDLLDLGVLLNVVALMLVLAAYASPPKDS